MVVDYVGTDDVRNRFKAKLRKVKNHWHEYQILMASKDKDWTEIRFGNGTSRWQLRLLHRNYVNKFDGFNLKTIEDFCS